MSGRIKAFKPHPYKIDEIPVFNIDYRGLIKYARSKGKAVLDLKDSEKELFIKGNSVGDIKKANIKVPQ